MYDAERKMREAEAKARRAEMRAERLEERNTELSKTQQHTRTLEDDAEQLLFDLADEGRDECAQLQQTIKELREENYALSEFKLNSHSDKLEHKARPRALLTCGRL